MTIAVSLKCVDGAVVAADRLFTHADASALGAFGSYDKKVFSGNGDYHTALIAGSGNKDALYSLSRNLLARFQREEKPERTSFLPVEDDLEEELNKLSGKLGEIPSLSTLVVVSQQSDPDLQIFRSDGLVVRPGGNTEVVGIGENSLVQFILDTLYSPGMGTMQGLALAVLLVQLTKKYCPQYCGGITDVGYVFYGVPLQYELKGREIKDLEEMFAQGIGRESFDKLLYKAEKLIS